MSQPAQQAQQAEFLMNPALLDSCLQLGGMVPQDPGTGTGKRTYIPASLAALYVGAAVGNEACVASVQRPVDSRDSESAVLRNHMVVGAAGAVHCRLEGLQSRSTTSKMHSIGADAGQGRETDMLYEISWLAADAEGYIQSIVAGAGTTITLSHSAGELPIAAASIQALQAALTAGAAGVQLSTIAQHAKNAMPAGSKAVADAGQLWGMLRTTAQECPGIAVTGSDLDAASVLSVGVDGASTLTLRSAAQQAQHGVPPAFDGYGSAAAARTLYVPQMRESMARSAPAPFQLLPQPRGSLTSLAPQAVVPNAIQAGQVLVAVKAVGLNFRYIAKLYCAYC